MATEADIPESISVTDQAAALDWEMTETAQLERNKCSSCQGNPYLLHWEMIEELDKLHCSHTRAVVTRELSKLNYHSLQRVLLPILLPKNLCLLVLSRSISISIIKLQHNPIQIKQVNPNFCL